MRSLPIYFLTLSLVSCYAGGVDYCDVSGKMINDRNCKKKDDKLGSLVAQYIATVGVRCLSPNAIRDLSGNCFIESQNLLQTIQETSDSMLYTEVITASISRSSGQVLGSLCMNKNSSSVFGAGANHYSQRIYSYDPTKMAAIKEIWNQDPGIDSNRSVVEARPKSLQAYIVGMPVSQLKAGEWIVTFSGLTGSCYETKGAYSKNFYRILEVVD